MATENRRRPAVGSGKEYRRPRSYPYSLVRAHICSRSAEQLHGRRQDEHLAAAAAAAAAANNAVVCRQIVAAGVKRQLSVLLVGVWVGHPECRWFNG